MRRKIYPDPVFVRNLKKLFAEKNVNHYQVASLLGKERKSVLSWVNCVTAPTVTELKKLCIEYRISADELLGIKNISGGKNDN